LAILLSAAVSVRTYAFLGLGDIVFDPSVYAQAVEQVIRLERQYAQLVQTYVTVRNQYTQMLRMAQQVPVNMSARYRAVANPLRSLTATNTYGTTGAWINAVNTGVGVAVAYSQSIERLEQYGAALGRVPADQLAHLRTLYGTVELADGANQNAMETIGRLRASAPKVQSAIQGLENDTLSADPNMNTEIAVLNKIGAAHMIALRSAQDSNQLLVTLAEAQMIDAKRTREAEVRAINQHIRFVSEGQAALRAQAAGSSAAMMAWRMP
jgi:hypothetical protein